MLPRLINLGPVLALAVIALAFEVASSPGAATARDPAAAALPAPVLLWPNGMPSALSVKDLAITPWLPASEKNTGAAVLIVPERRTGSQRGVPSADGVQMVKWLNDQGVAGFVLSFESMSSQFYDERVVVTHALQVIRAHAADFKISPDRLGLLGLGYGATIGADAIINQRVEGVAGATNPVERASGRPDFMALIGGSAPVGAEDPLIIPPTFLAGSTGPADHPPGMIELWKRLRGEVPVDAHFFTQAVPLSDFAANPPASGAWPEMFLSWMKFMGYLTDRPRVPLKGFVHLDGRTLPHGYVILTPLDQVGAGPIIARVINSTAGVPMGQFDVPAAQGPVPGRYRVDVRQNMNRWLSNSFSGDLVKVNGPITAAQAYFGHYRQLAPTLDDQRSYSKVHPSDPSDYIIEIKPDPAANLSLDLAVFSGDTPHPAVTTTIALGAPVGGLLNGPQNDAQVAYLEQIKNLPPGPVPGIPQPILLWSEGAPGAVADANGVFTDNDKPALYAFPAPTDHNTGAAFLILPGGGFTNLCLDNEGVQIAKFLNRNGLGGFVLRYRIGANYPIATATVDSHRAMQYLRAHAAEFRFSSDRLGTIGFSAGAQLEGTSFLNGVDSGNPAAADPLSRLSTAANFVALIYGGASKVDHPAAAPPVFMFNTLEDKNQLDQEIPVLDALHGAGVPVEAHWYQVGPHGTSLSPGDPELGQWPGLMVQWLQAGGFLAGKK